MNSFTSGKLNCEAELLPESETKVLDQAKLALLEKVKSQIQEAVAKRDANGLAEALYEAKENDLGEEINFKEVDA
jgi:hypothetical protein